MAYFLALHTKLGSSVRRAALGRAESPPGLALCGDDAQDSQSRSELHSSGSF